MSYDLEAFRIPPGMSPRDLNKLLTEGAPEEHAAALSHEEMERLADALMAVDPSAERHDAEAFVEIDTDSFQVSVTSAGASLTIPNPGLGHAGDTTRDRAFAYDDVMTAHGLTVWDPQTESIVGGGDDDRASAARMFGATSELVRDVADEDREPTARRGWKFWKR